MASASKPSHQKHILDFHTLSVRLEKKLTLQHHDYLNIESIKFYRFYEIAMLQLEFTHEQTLQTRKS
jgi:hypothetical protein